MISPPSTRRLIAKASLATTMTVLLFSCGDSKQQPPAIVVTFASPPPTALTAGATTSLTVTVSNDTGSGNVIWTCIPGQESGECGTFTPDTIHSDIPISYQAPAQIPAGNTVTVTATSVTDSTKSVSATITID